MRKMQGPRRSVGAWASKTRSTRGLAGKLGRGGRVACNCGEVGGPRRSSARGGEQGGGVHSSGTDRMSSSAIERRSGERGSGVAGVHNGAWPASEQQLGSMAVGILYDDERDSLTEGWKMGEEEGRVVSLPKPICKVVTPIHLG